MLRQNNCCKNRMVCHRHIRYFSDLHFNDYSNPNSVACSLGVCVNRKLGPHFDFKFIVRQPAKRSAKEPVIESSQSATAD